MARGWLLLLCAYLLVWVPINFAAELATSLPGLGFRGPLAVLELVVHALAAALAVAAGLALWRGSSDTTLAAAAVVVAAAIAIQSLYWTTLPGQTMPGDKLPLSILAAAHAAAWVWYLRRRGRSFR
jgi:hypothetical protein